MEITSISTKGQVVIPSAIRKELGLERGTKLAVLTDGTNVLLSPIPPPKEKVFKVLQAKIEALAEKADKRRSTEAEATRKTRKSRRR